jgi:hypothetical protein
MWLMPGQHGPNQCATLQPLLESQLAENDEPLFEHEAKADIFTSRFWLLQEGHFRFDALSAFMTRASNSVPHFKH